MTPTRKQCDSGISRVYELCNRYESGYGHGIKRDGLDLSKTPHSDAEMGEAYQIGYEAGSERYVEPPEVRSDEPVATVKSNNIPDDLFGCGHWLSLVSTAPNVTLDVGTKLYTHPAPSHVAPDVVSELLEQFKFIVAIKVSPDGMSYQEFHDWAKSRAAHLVTKYDAAIAGKEVK